MSSSRQPLRSMMACWCTRRLSCSRKCSTSPSPAGYIATFRTRLFARDSSRSTQLRRARSRRRARIRSACSRSSIGQRGKCIGSCWCCSRLPCCVNVSLAGACHAVEVVCVAPGGVERSKQGRNRDGSRHEQYASRVPAARHGSESAKVQRKETGRTGAGEAPSTVGARFCGAPWHTTGKGGRSSMQTVPTLYT